MPLSDTLIDTIKPYALGDKLRALRLKRKMGLVELGKHTGLSPALLSKIENGKLVPTIPTLTRIALVFSVGLDHFFSARTAPALAIVKRGERQRFPAQQGDRIPQYFFESLDFPVVDRKLNAYYAEFEPIELGKIARHAHDGAEFIYVMSGRAAVLVGDSEHLLDAGDSMYFDSSVPHGYRRHGGRTCAAIVVTTGQPAQAGRTA